MRGEKYGRSSEFKNERAEVISQLCWAEGGVINIYEGGYGVVGALGGTALSLFQRLDEVSYLLRKSTFPT